MGCEGRARKEGGAGSLQCGEGAPGAGAGEPHTLTPGPLDQVILGEVFSDYTPAQVVVKELRASAGPLEQRKFIAEAQPYRYAPAVRLLEVTCGSGRSIVRGQTRVRVLDLPLRSMLCRSVKRASRSEPRVLSRDGARDMRGRMRRPEGGPRSRAGGLPSPL